MHILYLQNIVNTQVLYYATYGHNECINIEITGREGQLGNAPRVHVSVNSSE